MISRAASARRLPRATTPGRMTARRRETGAYAMSEPVAFTVLGLAPKVLAAACVGGAISMVLGGGRWWERLTRGIAGPIVGLLLYPIGSPFLWYIFSKILPPELMPSMVDLDVAAGIFISLLGIIGCQALLEAGKATVEDADDYVHRVFGGRK